jgi:hypothetical protein
MRPTLLVAAATAAAALVVPVGRAAAATWTPPATFAADPAHPEDLGDAAPRVGIASDGSALVAFVRSSGTGNRVRPELRAAIGDGSGRFGAARTLTRAHVSSWSVAARPGGDRLVAWTGPEGLRAALFRHGRWTVRVLSTARRSEIDSLQVATDPAGGWALVATRFAARRTTVQALDLTADARPAGPLQDLGPGDFGNEARPVFALAVDRAGTAFVAYRTDGEPIPNGPGPGTLVRARPHGRGWQDAGELPGLVDARLTPRAAGGAVLAATKLTRSGDAGAFGAPVSALVSPVGTLGPLSGPALPQPGRAFGPSAVELGAGRRLLVGSLRDRPAAFSPLAPVAAAVIGADGTLANGMPFVTHARSSEPIALPLSGGRALVLWTGDRGWGVRLASPAGALRTTVAPPQGGPAPFHFNATNRDARSSRRHVIVAWERAGVVRVTTRRL